MALIRTRAIWTGVAGSPAYSNFYWVGDLTSAGLFAEQHADVLEAVQAYQNSAVEWSTEPAVVEIDPTTGAVLDSNTVTVYTGTGAVLADVLPRMTQALIRLRTGVYTGGREIRGRHNYPYIAETYNESGGVPDPDLLDAIELAYAPLLGTLGGTGLAVYSPTNGNSAYVTSVSASPQWATLRSRSS